MTHTAQFDPSPLAAAKPELDDSLGQVSHGLEIFFADPEGGQAALQDVLAEFRRARDALQTLSLDGVVVFCGEIEKLLQELASGAMPPSLALQNTFQRALFALTHYLDALIDGASNSALRLFPDYQELQQARGMEMAFEVDLFFPNLNVNLPPSVLEQPMAASPQEHIKAERAKYQAALLKWLRQDSPGDALQVMRNAVQAVMGCVPQDRQRAFWWVASAMFDCLIYDGRPSELSPKKLLSRIDLQMKSLAEGQAMDTRGGMNELLYLIACSYAVSDTIAEVKQVFALDSYLSQAVALAANQTGPVLDAMRAQLATAQEEWERCAYEGAVAPEFAGKLAQVATLADQLDRNTLQYLCHQIQSMLEQAHSPEQVHRIEFDMAMALLLLDSGIEHYHYLGDEFHKQARILGQRLLTELADELSGESGEENKLDDLIALYRQMAARDVAAPLASEILVNLRQAEQVLKDFSGDAGKRPSLTKLEPLLKQVQGGLSILSLAQAGQLLLSLRQAVERYAGGKNPSPDETKIVAGALDALKAYGQELSQGQPPDVAPLEAALRQMQSLQQPVPAPVTAAQAPEVSAQAAEAAAPWEGDELLEVFLEEAQEVLERIRTNLEIVRPQPDNRDAIVTIRRGFHTLKGSGRMVGLTDLGEVAAAVERAMNKWLQGDKPATPGLLKFMGDAEAAFRNWVASLRTKGGAKIEADELVAAAQQIENGAELAAPPELVVELAPVAAPIEAPAVAPAPVEIAIEELTLETVLVPEAMAAITEEPIPTPAAVPAAEPEQVVIGSIKLSPSLFGIATEESAQHIAELSRYLADLRRKRTSIENNFMRAAHTLAGVNRIMGFLQVAELAYALELWLEARIDRPFVLSDAQLSLLERTIAALDHMSLTVRKRQEPQAHPELIALLQADKNILDGTAEAQTLEASLAQAAEPVQPAWQSSAEAASFELPEVDESFVRYDAEVPPEPAVAPSQPLPEYSLPEILEPALPMVQEASAEAAPFELPAAGEAPQPLLEFALPEITAPEIAATEEGPAEAAPFELPAAEEALAPGEVEIRPELPEASLQSAPEITLPEITELEIPVVAQETPAEAAPFEFPVAEEELVHPEAKVQPEAAEAPPQPLPEFILPEIPEPEAPATQETALDATMFELPARELPVPKIQTPQEAPAQAVQRAGYTPEKRVVKDDVDEQLLPIFMEEANDLYPQIGSGLRAWREQPDDKSLAHNLQRGLHTLKGGARMAGAMRLGELAHNTEECVVQAMSREQYDAAFWDELENYFDRIGNSLEQLRSGKPATEEAAPEVHVVQVAAEPVVEPAHPADTGRVVKDDVDEQLLPIFLEEASDLYPQIGSGLSVWRAQPDDKTHCRNLQRNLHTMKGGARMAGAMRLGELIHLMESQVVQQGLVNKSHAETFWAELQNYCDRIGNALEQLRSAKPAEAEARPETKTETKVEAEIPPESAQPAQPKPPGGVERLLPAAMLRVRSDTLDNLVNEAGEISVTRARVEAELRGVKTGLVELMHSVTRLREQLREIEIHAESQMQAHVSVTGDAAEHFDPLEFDRFTRFQELTRSMNESVHDVQTVQQGLLKNLDETAAALSAQNHLNRELQQSLLAIRMVPFASVSERLYRIVRQTGKELNKKANLELRGTEVELDRSVLEKMTAPFEHLLRNAIAHGLESPERRAQLDKPPIGDIRLSLRQEGNEVVFEFSDDGGGLDLKRLRQKGVEQGMFQAGEEVSDEQAMQLIFAPGLSTATAVTEISGRGVGMDVVRSEITALGGRIDVFSVPEKGTRFIIHLPLTLVVTQAVLVQAGNAAYAIPSSMVQQVQQLKPAALEEAYRNRHVEWQGASYPLHYLPNLLGDADHSAESRPYNALLLLRSGEQHMAVHVDALIGNQEVVVKNIGPQLSRLPGIAGATVLGNGSVMLILNPVQLTQRTGQAVHKIAKPAAAEPVAVQHQPMVMVVDDSLTVRKITSRLLTRAGYEVVTAEDGVDALEKLAEVMPDVMLLDIEMPRMDGFELTKILRNDPKTKDLPIIMITSRTADKHRDYAKELGINVYLGKPYQEEDLLPRIANFVTAHPAH